MDPFGLSAERGQEYEIGAFTQPDRITNQVLDQWMDMLIANRIIEPQYKQMVIKALHNLSDEIISHYKRNYNDDIESLYTPYTEAIEQLIYCIERGRGIPNFSNGMKVRIEITGSVNTAALNVMGDFAGFIPVLGEIYGLVDYMSDEDADLSDLGSALISAITEKDIAELTPYADELDSLSKGLGLISIINDIRNWNSEDNIKTELNIYIQQNQGASFAYKVYVDDDMSFKEMYTGFTGTVIKPEDNPLSVICY